MSTTVLLGMALGLLSLAALTLLWARRRQDIEPEYHYCRCPACAQKIRFRAERTGRTGHCPRCMLPLVLRVTATSQDAVSNRLTSRRLVLRRDVGRRSLGA